MAREHFVLEGTQVGVGVSSGELLPGRALRAAQGDWSVTLVPVIPEDPSHPAAAADASEIQFRGLELVANKAKGR